MRCTGYQMARYKGTQASHLYEKIDAHTIVVVREIEKGLLRIAAESCAEGCPQVHLSE